jgi:hypothetical protein
MLFALFALPHQANLAIGELPFTSNSRICATGSFGSSGALNANLAN